MTEQHSDRTRASLLKNAGLGDQVAWMKLDALYRPMLTKWALRSGAQSADADEAVSEVLGILVTLLGKFEYDPARSFRAYLMTMLRHQLSRLYRRAPFTPDDSLLKDIVVDERSETELIDLLIDEEERLAVPAILLIAQKRCRKDSTWRAWEMTELEGHSAALVARSLNISIASVYVCRQRVADMIKQIGEEVRKQTD